MELKNYQQQVINDLKGYLDFLDNRKMFKRYFILFCKAKEYHCLCKIANILTS